MDECESRNPANEMDIRCGCGVSAVLHELTEAANVSVVLDEASVPLSEPVRGPFGSLRVLDEPSGAPLPRIWPVSPVAGFWHQVGLPRPQPRQAGCTPPQTRGCAVANISTIGGSSPGGEPGAIHRFEWPDNWLETQDTMARDVEPTMAIHFLEAIAAGKLRALFF
jgi:hypothetical protein